jgi:hypothetical protein
MNKLVRFWGLFFGPVLSVNFFGLPLFFKGVLRKVVYRAWFFDGKNVVKSVVIVDRKLAVFAA